MKGVKPNIGFLMTDQQRHDQLGPINGVLKAPNLDALAGDGVFFSRARYANVSLIDGQVGAIMRTLKEIGEDENTMIVFCRDHGDLGCDLNKVDNGPFLLDVLMRVPLIVKPPNPVIGDYCRSVFR